MNPYAPPRAEGARSSDASGDVVTDGTLFELRETRTWAFAVGALLLLWAGFAILAALMVLWRSSVSEGNTVTLRGPNTGWVLAAAALYAYPGVRLCAYSRAISRVLATRSTTDLQIALRQQKAVWKFVATVVCLLTVVVVISAIAELRAIMGEVSR